MQGALTTLHAEAERGCVRAQFAMGSVYRFGNTLIGVDLQLAWKWWHAAAEQGDATAQRSLGVMSERGTGRPRDDKLAFDFYVRAAEQGESEAQCYVGECYEHGTGVDINFECAKLWYARSASKGYTEARPRLDRLNARLNQLHRQQQNDGEHGHAVAAVHLAIPPPFVVPLVVPGGSAAPLPPPAVAP